MFSDSHDISRWDGFGAERAMELSLEAACRRNLAYLEQSPDDLPDDLSPIADMFESDVLSFVSATASSVAFHCFVTFTRPQRFRASTETYSRVVKDGLSYSIGSTMECAGALYKIDDDSRNHLVDYVVESLADRFTERGFTVSVTSHGDALRIYIGWCTDKEAAGYVYHVTDYSQIDAIKCGVPASDVFA